MQAGSAGATGSENKKAYKKRADSQYVYLLFLITGFSISCCLFSHILNAMKEPRQECGASGKASARMPC